MFVLDTRWSRSITNFSIFDLFYKNKYAIRKETKGRWERRRGRSDTLGRAGFAPPDWMNIKFWSPANNHSSSPTASSATMIEICIRREVKHSDKVHDLVRGANSPHDFREKSTWSTYPVKKKKKKEKRTDMYASPKLPSSVAYASLPINSNTMYVRTKIFEKMTMK